MTEGRSFLLSPWQDQADRVTVARALNCTVGGDGYADWDGLTEPAPRTTCIRMPVTSSRQGLSERSRLAPWGLPL